MGHGQAGVSADVCRLKGQDTKSMAMKLTLGGSGTESGNAGDRLVPEARGAGAMLRRSLPWAVGAAIIAYLVWRIEPGPLAGALSRAHLSIYLPALAVFVYLNFLVDTQNLHAILGHFNHGMRFSESMVIRGASYLLMIVDYSLGMGSIIYYLKRYRGIPIIRGTGLMFYLNYITHVSLLLLAIAGCLMTGPLSTPWPMRIAATCAALLVVAVTLVAGLKLLPDYRFLAKVKHSNLMKVFIETPVSAYLLHTAYRCAFYLTFVLFFYAAVRAFNMDIPLIVLIAYVPVVLLVISVPISAFGLGTSQAAMLILFNGYGSQAQILAFSLAYSASIVILRGALGALYYGIITRRVAGMAAPGLRTAAERRGNEIMAEAGPAGK